MHVLRMESLKVASQSTLKAVNKSSLKARQETESLSLLILKVLLKFKVRRFHLHPLLLHFLMEHLHTQSVS